MLDEVASLNHQSLIAWLFHHLAHELRDPSFENRFHLCGPCASCLLDNCPDPFHAQDRGIHLADERWRIPPSADWFGVVLIPP